MEDWFKAAAGGMLILIWTALMLLPVCVCIALIYYLVTH